MADEKRIALMHDFVKSLENEDREKFMSIVTDDFCWNTPFGRFCGRDELNRYLDWFHSTTKNLKFQDVGVEAMVQGDRGIYEHEISGNMQGENAKFLSMCSYKFKDDKIHEINTVYDRLSIAEQASNKWLPKKVVNTLVKQLHKGLD